MATTTCIRNAAWVAAWDEAAARHVYQRDIDVAFAGDCISHVGPGYDGAVDREVDGRGLFVMPGLVDIHSHPTTEPAQRGVREEHGVAAMYQSSLYQRSVVFHLDDEGRRAGAEVAYAELLASGVTSLADLSGAFEGWTDILARSGLRGFVAPGYASARWRLDNDFELKFDLGRPGRPRRLRRGVDPDRRNRGAPFGPVDRRHLPGPDRHLFGRPVARQPGRSTRAGPAVHHPHRPERARVPRDDPAPRHDADPVGPADRPLGSRHHPGPCHLHRRALLAALAGPGRPRPAGRQRRRRGPLPDALRALRSSARGSGALHPRRGGHWAWAPTARPTTCSRRCARPPSSPGSPPATWRPWARPTCSTPPPWAGRRR